MVVISLFDESGNMVRPWAEVGCSCYCFDIVNPRQERIEQVGHGEIHYRHIDFRTTEALQQVRDCKPDILFGFPPCTDLAVSGAAHFAHKLQNDPLVFVKALYLAKITPNLGEELQIPWFIENPVGKLSTMYRKPDYIFNPRDFGGYLPEDDVHPRFPEYIVPRDAYNKKTCLWVGQGLRFPAKRIVQAETHLSKQHTALGGKSAKTKKIRSETPRGFAKAVFEANKYLIQHTR